MTKRIVMPKGHTELSLGGNSFKIDETGAFEVPDEHAQGLIESHGGRLQPGEGQLAVNVQAADDAVAHAQAVLKQRQEDSEAAHKAADDFAARKKAIAQKALDEANAKAAAEKDAKAASDAAAQQKTPQGGKGGGK